MLPNYNPRVSNIESQKEFSPHIKINITLVPYWFHNKSINPLKHLYTVKFQAQWILVYLYYNHFKSITNNRYIYQLQYNKYQ